jgi:hypothetical protein
MSALENEKTTFGATIEPSPSTTPSPLPLSARDAPPTPLTASSELEVPRQNPFYAISSGARTSTSLKQPPSYAQHADLEAQRSNAELGLTNTASTSATKTKENSMWPSLKAQKTKAKAERCKESWNPMRRWGLGRRQKMIVTAVIALLIIGAAVGIGVGVSKAVGGGVKDQHGDTRPIGERPT